ncbi:MAG: glycosyltransferase family 2 protein [Thermodesulfovibrionales bacterium]
MIATIIIPVYNEKNLIPRLISEVVAADTPGYEKEIIVVDDGSSDGTAEALRPYAEKAQIRVITHERNRGKAAAIKTALREARGDILMIQDADLEYSPLDYRRLIEPFKEGAVQVVYGSRFLKASWPDRMRPANWFANRLFTLLVNLLYGSRITDEGTAYKVFRREAVGPVDIACSGFEFCPEVTAKLLKRGIRIVEVPISYTARGKKEGKKPTFIDGIKVLWTIVKYRFRE